MESRSQLRAELLNAIADVRRQINRQQTASSGVFNGSGQSGVSVALRELRSELAQLEEVLAGLKSAHA